MTTETSGTDEGEFWSRWFPETHSPESRLWLAVIWVIWETSDWAAFDDELIQLACKVLGLDAAALRDKTKSKAMRKSGLQRYNP